MMIRSFFGHQWSSESGNAIHSAVMNLAQLDPVIAETFDDIIGVVLRMVINDQRLLMRVDVIQDRLQRSTKKMSMVVSWNNNGDKRIHFNIISGY